jgi:hypothetical protein
VRIRIALTTAMAVTGMTTGVFTLSGSPRAVTARDALHRAAHTSTSAAPSGTVYDTPLADPTLSGTALSGTALARFAIPAKVHAASGPIVVPGIPSAPFGAPAVAPVVAPPPPPPPPPPVTDSDSVDTADWMCIRVHESGDRYNDPAEPSGAYGILISTWREFGYSGWPYQAAPGVQDQLALKLHALYGFDPWSSRFACGL